MFLTPKDRVENLNQLPDGPFKTTVIVLGLIAWGSVAVLIFLAILAS